MPTVSTNPSTIWQATLGELEVTLSKANFTTWFKQTKILDVTDTTLTLGVPNTFAQEWLRNKYHKQILESLKRHYPTLARIEYRVVSAQQPPAPAPAPSQTTPAGPRVEASPPREEALKPGYTFTTFIVGNSNRLAHAAATAVAKKPGVAQYNPLFLYGGVGLGKTHLMQAIGNAIQVAHPKSQVVYASCEAFVTQFVEALQNKRLDAFKKRYRNADVLLIDDIQFLSGKDGMQEEFFHTFNALHQTNRQIIMTSDSRPLSIPKLAPRLSSRFGWGMVADIQSPDMEMRQAILRHKCEEKAFPLDPELIAYITREIHQNVRELEGILNSLITHCELYDVPPSLKLVAELIEQAGRGGRSMHLSAESIFETVASYYSLEVGDVLGKRRHKELVYPRQIVMYLMRHEMNHSFPKIGKALGGKDHTTIMHGVDKITRELLRNDTLQRDITLIKERLYTT